MAYVGNGNNNLRFGVREFHKTKLAGTAKYYLTLDSDIAYNYYYDTNLLREKVFAPTNFKITIPEKIERKSQ